MRRAIYPGTFDPITHGHLDVLERATHLFEEVIVGVAVNAGKQPIFTLEERVALVRQSITHLVGVEAQPIEGLTVDFARENKCVAIIRGLRAVSDFEYEFQLAQMNRHLNGSIDTVFLMPSSEQFYTSSAIVRAVAVHDVERMRAFAPWHVLEALRDRLKELS